MQQKSLNIEYEFRTLLANLRKTVELCFFTEVQQQTNNNYHNNILESENGKQFFASCLEILQHHLILNDCVVSSELKQDTIEPNTSPVDLNECVRKDEQREQEQQQRRKCEKLFEDFEYLYETSQLTQTTTKFQQNKSRLKHFLNKNNTYSPSYTSASNAKANPHSSSTTSIRNYLWFWLRENWKSHCLTLCLQALIADSELKDLYYEKGAFLQSEDYATAFCICVTSLEQNQFNLLSQIQADLYQNSLLYSTATEYLTENLNKSKYEKIDLKPSRRRRRRTGSHPNISFRSLLLVQQEKRKRHLTIGGNEQSAFLQNRRNLKSNPFAIRKTKSLPNILLLHLKWRTTDGQKDDETSEDDDHNQRKQKENESLNRQANSRPRCKTLDGSRLYKRIERDSHPRNTPKRLIPNLNNNNYNIKNNNHNNQDNKNSNIENINETNKEQPLQQTTAMNLTISLINPSSTSLANRPDHEDNADDYGIDVCQPSTSRQSFNAAASQQQQEEEEDLHQHHLTSTPYQQKSNQHNHQSQREGHDEVDCQPSTSKQSFQRRPRHLNSTAANNNPTLSNASSSSISSSNSINHKQIEIINCDNIKIWTDQGEELATTTNTTTSSFNSNSNNSLSIDFPTNNSLNLLTKHGKSISPINNFFSTLFGTPQTYTSWSPKQYQDYNNLEAMDACCHAFPCNKYHQTNPSPMANSVFNAFMPTVGKKLRSRKSQNLFEDGVSTLDYSATSPGSMDLRNHQANSVSIEVPSQGLAANAGGAPSGTSSTSTATTQSMTSLRNTQTLTDYLIMSQRSRNTTDLEKENAHFTISEAVISAIEHIKWAKKDAEEFNKNIAKATTATDWLEKEQSQSGANEGATEQQSNSKLVDDSDLLEHTPYAESGCYDELSAEIIGLSIISKFNDKEMPKVSELKWLVGDGDTPQNLLPMPDNSPTKNPDENIQTSMTRGTRYWAPPRPQIIFTDHPTPNRKALLLKQNYRCAGCGMRVAKQNISSFRYCTYLGKYHCTGCHRNQMSATPAKILSTWDFKCYPVSVFAYRLLDQMNNFPLFYVPDLNPALYMQAKALKIARQKRRQLAFVKQFIKTCRFAVKEQHYFAQIPDYITDDPDLWSLSDFIDVYDKSMERSIEDLVLKCENHIHNCVLCTARGFYCEHCNKEQILFPWEKKTFRCDRCGSCYHFNCWRSMSESCNKCQRIHKRQEQEII